MRADDSERMLLTYCSTRSAIRRNQGGRMSNLLCDLVLSRIGLFESLPSKGEAPRHRRTDQSGVSDALAEDACGTLVVRVSIWRRC